MHTNITTAIPLILKSSRNASTYSSHCFHSQSETRKLNFKRHCEWSRTSGLKSSVSFPDRGQRCVSRQWGHWGTDKIFNQRISCDHLFISSDALPEFFLVLKMAMQASGCRKRTPRMILESEWIHCLCVSSKEALMTKQMVYKKEMILGAIWSYAK